MDFFFFFFKKGKRKTDFFFDFFHSPAHFSTKKMEFTDLFKQTARSVASPNAQHIVSVLFPCLFSKKIFKPLKNQRKLQARERKGELENLIGREKQERARRMEETRSWERNEKGTW